MVEPVDIIEDFEDLKTLVFAKNIFRNRSQEDYLSVEYKNGEIINGHLVWVWKTARKFVLVWEVIFWFKNVSKYLTINFV